MKSQQLDEKIAETESIGRRLADGATDMVESAKNNMSEYKDRAREVLAEANNTSLADVEKKVGNYIKANPGRSIATVAAAGFLLGFLFSRK